MIVIWVVGGWFAYQVATQQGLNQRSEVVRTGSMQVTSCERSAAHAWLMFVCRGPITFAPEDTWQRGSASQLRGRTTVPLLSTSDLTGRTVAFFTYDASSTRTQGAAKLDEIATPDEQRRRTLTAWNVLAPLSAFGGSLLVGIVGAVLVAKVRP